MVDQPQVSSDRVIEILTREPMGAALWRAAVAEATVEAYASKLDELQRPKTDIGRLDEDPRLP